ncbi:MAG: hypothetical protein C5B50_16625 [Verrucomicrobia bacterium]|nr:MAG: hypothetical protein C5B50_16625 [Verrucomicrobiota bacterium]
MSQKRSSRKNQAQGSRTDKPGAPANNRRRSRLWLFRLFAAVLLPVLLLILLEGALRLAGYGYATGLFKRMRIGQEEFLVENDQFSLRFFPPELARTPGPIRMKPHKQAGTYRIFILGESAAMGDPEPAYGAGRYMEALLRERFPEAKFEVINVAFTAINSNVILPIARDCAGQEGDLWIIYMGNNEMVGPFGAATVFGLQSPPLGLVRLGLALQKTRLGQLLMAVGRQVRGKSAGPASWGGMQMFLGNQVPPNDPRKERTYRNFQQNLKDILRIGRTSGAQVLLNTVAVNLKDCPPFASVGQASRLSAEQRGRLEELLAQARTMEGAGKFAQACSNYEAAAKLDAQSAETEYRWGNCLLRRERVEGRGSNGGDGAEASKASGSPALLLARQQFQQACDLDALPFRADSRINGLIAEAAREKRADQAVRAPITLFDAAGWFATNSPLRLAGNETFYEHVHFNFDGNYRLGLAWAEQASRLLPPALTNHCATNWMAQEVCERRLGLTDWNRKNVFDGMVRRMRQPPLSAQSNNELRTAELESQIARFRLHMDAAGAEQARKIYLESIQRWPDDYTLHENFATFLVASGDVPGAAAQWNVVRGMIPQDYLADFRLGELLAMQGKLEEALVSLRGAIAKRPFASDPWFNIGQIHFDQGKLELAYNDFSHAHRLRPQEPEYLYEMGRCLVLLKRGGEAVELFREAIRINPDYWQARDGLAGQLALEGKISEAKAEFAEVIRLEPRYARAHLNLGVALLKQGDAGAAAVEFEKTVSLEPTNQIAREYLRQAQKARR